MPRAVLAAVMPAPHVPVEIREFPEPELPTGGALLRTALSEVAARTLRTVDGGTLPGREVVHGLLHRTLRGLTRERRDEQRGDIRQSLVDSMQVHRDPKGLLERFDALETPWTPPERTGFESSEPSDPSEQGAAAEAG